MAGQRRWTTGVVENDLLNPVYWIQTRCVIAGLVLLAGAFEGYLHKKLTGLQRWALALRARSNHNKATCALANKIARIAWATWRHGTAFDPDLAAMNACA